MSDYYDSSLYKLVREATPEDDEWCANPYCSRNTAEFFFIYTPDGDEAQEFGMCEDCARAVGMPLPPEPFDWEWIGYCQYPIFDPSAAAYESDCRNPAVARGWWGDDTDGWLLCREHLDKILATDKLDQALAGVRAEEPWALAEEPYQYFEDEVSDE